MYRALWDTWNTNELGYRLGNRPCKCGWQKQVLPIDYSQFLWYYIFTFILYIYSTYSLPTRGEYLGVGRILLLNFSFVTI